MSIYIYRHKTFYWHKTMYNSNKYKQNIIILINFIYIAPLQRDLTNKQRQETQEDNIKIISTQQFQTQGSWVYGELEQEGTTENVKNTKSIYDGLQVKGIKEIKQAKLQKVKV